MNSKKWKIAHNSLNNGVRAVLRAFLDFQFFLKHFDQKIRFLGEIKIKNCPKTSHQSGVNLNTKVKKTVISLAWIWFCVKNKMDWWWFSMFYFMNFQQISSREYRDFEATFEKNTPPVYSKFDFLLNYAVFSLNVIFALNLRNMSFFR